MANTENTRIDHLTALGHELAEEHLPLVSGGAKKKVTTQATYRENNPDAQVDVEIEW